MKFLPYLLKHLRRNWLRTLSTVLAMALCIFLFCTLQTVLGRRQLPAAERHERQPPGHPHAVSLVFNLPLAYKRADRGPCPASSGWPSRTGSAARSPRRRRASAPGGSDSASTTRLRATSSPNLAVEPSRTSPCTPSTSPRPTSGRPAWRTMRGCIIGRKLANRFGWKVGDTFFLESFIPPHRKTERPVRVRGEGHLRRRPRQVPRHRRPNLMLSAASTSTRRPGSAPAGTYAVEIDDPGPGGEGQRRDRRPLRELGRADQHRDGGRVPRASFVAMAGNLALLLNGIGIAVTFTILLVTANTMSMAVRERRTEIAVLKTLGFKRTGDGPRPGGVAPHRALGRRARGPGASAPVVIIHALPSLNLIGTSAGLSEPRPLARVAALGFSAGPRPRRRSPASSPPWAPTAPASPTC